MRAVAKGITESSVKILCCVRAVNTAEVQLSLDSRYVLPAFLFTSVRESDIMDGSYDDSSAVVVCADGSTMSHIKSRISHSYIRFGFR